MLDLEVVTPPDMTGIDILTLDEFKRHMRIVNTKFDADLTDIIKETADLLHGRDGQLNRTIFPMTWRRYLRDFPSGDMGGRDQRRESSGTGKIELPFPPLIEVVAVTIEDGSSPDNIVDPATYEVHDGYIGAVAPKVGMSWPAVAAPGSRAVSITYRAGYTAFPLKLKRLLKIMAAHNYENPVATINETRILQINRKAVFGVDDLRAALRVPLRLEDWE